MTTTATRSRRMPSANAPRQSHGRNPEPLPELGPNTILIDVDRLYPSELNRDEYGDDDPELLELAESLKTVKLIHPLNVAAEDRPSGRHRILTGERRWRAAILAGWKTIPCNVCQLDARGELLLRIDENVARKNLNAMELARFLQQLVLPIADGGAGMTREQVAARYGRRDGSWVTNILKLQRLPAAWQKRVSAGELGQRQGKALCAYIDRPDVLACADVSYRKNPTEWATADDFDRQLSEVVQRLDSLKVSQDTPAASAEDPTAGADLSTLPLQRRSAPVDHRPRGEGERDERAALDSTESILNAAFDLLDGLRPEQLGPVATYVDRRARGVTGAAAREPSKRARKA